MKSLRAFVGWGIGGDIAYPVSGRSFERHGFSPSRIVPIRQGGLRARSGYTRGVGARSAIGVFL
jgi:hypothetical protein